MTSSILTGNRRGVATRKLTVLGTVPKPINLPSQRLENHGLDPNVEIVPKGTLTWGSRPSLSAPNAWGTSTTSFPHIDGSAGSPSHRPSSGSGIRPSTACSDRSHEPVSNAWGPNSRPSSASGILTSSQISAASTCSQSAETRPGSSHLSRFADYSVDNTISCGAAGSAERLGTGSSKSSEFTLSTGDFPSLGSDKNSDTHSQQGHSSQGRPHSSQGRPHSSQGRPASASGTDSKRMEILEPRQVGNRNTDHSDHGTVNTWKADNPPYPGHDASPNMDDWHSPHPTLPYPDMNMPPSRYDSWHNPSYRPANASWYRGGASGGPARPGPPGPPGNYPVHYPRVPSRPLSPQFPRQDAGPGGFYPNNCRPYGPYTPPEQYMGPGHSESPVRPDPYHGPVPYEGYYGPPRPNFYNSNARGASIMGMARPFHNQYPTQHQNYDSANFHGRPSGYGTVVTKEHTEPNQAHGTQGQYRVLLKQHDGSGNYNEEKEHSATSDLPILDSRRKREEIALSSSLCGEAFASESTKGVEGQGADIDRNLVADSCKTGDDSLARRPEAANLKSGDLHRYPVNKKNATLMGKVESLNNKAQFADNHSAGGTISKEKSTSSKDVITRADPFTKVANANSAGNPAYTPNVEIANLEELNTSSEHEHHESTKDWKVPSVPVNSVGAGEYPHFVGQKRFHAKSVDNHAKSRSNRYDRDEWMRKPPGSELSMNSTTTSVKSGVVLESDASNEAAEIQEFRTEACGGDVSHTSLDPADLRAQRAKMKEIAAQRAKELQREEEERTREQKAKALAKLEELNRRTLAERSNLKPIHAPSESIDVQTIKQETGLGAIPTADSYSVEASNGDSDRPEAGKQGNNDTRIFVHKTNESSKEAVQETVATPDITQETALDIQHNTNVMQKQVSYRQKHSLPPENSMCGKQTTPDSIEGPKDSSEVEVNASSTNTLPGNEETRVQHNKNNWTGRNNNSKKLDPSPLLQVESGQTIPSTSVVEAVSVPSESLNETVDTLSSREIPDMAENQEMSEKTRETHGKLSNQWKSHPHRKTSRNQQANRPASRHHATEAVMWAPVKSLGKSESDEVGHSSVIEATKPTGKSGVDFQNGQKMKRAEMERYVPKPVAEEQSLEVNFQQTSHTIEKSETGSPSVESGRLDGSTGGKSAAAYTGQGENQKHKRNVRANASWHQRSLAESPSVEGNTARKASDQKQTTSNAGNVGKQQLKHTDDGDIEVPSESVTPTMISKSYGASRQRRQPYRAHRASGHYYSASDNTVETTEKNEHHSSDLSHNELRKNSTKIENQNAVAENIKPSWQPKSQVFTHGKQGIRGYRGGQRGENAAAIMNEDYSTSSQRTVAEAREAHYQESRREGSADQAREQYDGRAQRGYDNNYRARDSAHKTSRQNFHKDQQVEYHDKPVDSFQQNLNDGGVQKNNRTSGSRYRERVGHYS